MMKKFSWTYKIGLILGVLIVVWIAAALLLNTASAEGLPLSLRLSSRLSADYRVDKVGPLKALSLSIIGDMLRDMGMGAQEAEEHEASMKALMEDPVPTATARDFEGAAPFTATPTHTSTPTTTPTSTATPTSTFTPRPTATNTPKPTSTEVAATATSAGPVDSKTPSPPVLSLSPAPGSTLTTCDFTIVSMTVFDPAYSSGFSPSEVLVKHETHSGGYYYQQVPFISGGFVSGPGSDWSATYGGPMILSDVEVGETFKVYGKIKDIAGTGWIISSAYTYTYSGAVDCP
jgi:hypothetical protein